MRGGAGAGDLLDDVAAGTEAGIDQPGGVEPVERVGVDAEALGLAQDRRFPVEAEPGEILEDRVLVFGPAARGVDDLAAQDRKSVVWGRRVVVRLNVGGRRGLTKKKTERKEK